MDRLPENTWLSANYCNRWSGRLVVDGKYVKVKGYDQKIPFIYGIDYLTHDIPVGILAPSENEEAYYKFFVLLKTCKYPFQIVIADDNGAVRPALAKLYPSMRVQLCQNHYLENWRQALAIRTNDKYRDFFYGLNAVFDPKLHHKAREAKLQYLYFRYGKYSSVVQTVLVDVAKRSNELFAFKYRLEHCPNTTNIIESFNSHLQGRLKSIKGFQSFRSAERWLNAWMIRRRTKPFTDCEEPFKHLNGKCSLEVALKKDLKFPEILGIRKLKKSG